jgi:hypothetical protein
MAPRTKKNSPSVALASRAREHGTNAFGARYLAPGFALTPELDLEFALGGFCGFAPLTLLPDLVPGNTVERGEAMNRNVAIAELRVGGPFIAHPAEYPTDPAPIDEGEARRILANEGPHLGFLPAHYLALEAFVGPSVVLAGVVSALGDVALANWNNGRTSGLFHVLRGLLLRAPEAESNAARVALEALYRSHEEYPAAANLGILLHGRPLIEQRGYKYSAQYGSFQTSARAEPASINDLLHCDEDGPWVASQFAALWTALRFKPQKRMAEPSPARLFFLGGDAALETELRVVTQYPGTMQADAFASYEHLASPLAVACMKHLASADSKVRKRAEAWLKARG